MDKGKLSIIIPVYNTEKYLRKCLDSVLKQTYTNLEIILVNDGSTDNSKKIINEYCNKEKRVKYVENKKNLGLFRARIEGAKTATGDFIAFLDSDDYVTIDYYRTMIYNMYQNKSDMVLGNTILEYDNGEHIIFSISDLNFHKLEGPQILDSYFHQDGLNFSWHTLCNKIYTMDLWKKAEPHYQKIEKHLIMTEDFSFSTVLFYYAKRLTRVPNDGLYYCKHESGASTSLSGLNLKRMLKNLDDLTTSFNFVENFMKEVNIYNQYQENFTNWKALYRSQQDSYLKMARLTDEERKQVSKKINDFCNIKKTIEHDSYFSSIQTEWNNKYEQIKQDICNPEIKYISFDIFDTLVVRPFLNPFDLFILLNQDFRLLNKNQIGIDFSKMRMNAEQQARIDLWNSTRKDEEVTLDEIYDVMVRDYGISKLIANKMKKLEIELELKFCTRRDTAYELYEMALSIGKKVICTSDMYLPKSVIQKILSKNGYKQIQELYLSSEIMKTKSTGNLYRHVLKALNSDGDDIIHIGDNYHSDVEKAKENNLKAIHMRKTTDVFFDKQLTNNLSQVFKKDLPDWQDNLSAMNFSGIRTMLAVVANKYFDNPWRSFRRNSDFNADPYLMGYYALGLHLFGVANWLLQDTKSKGYDNIVFMARDGYLPMEAYKLLRNLYDKTPNEKYLYISRKASIPLIVKDKSDLYKLTEVISWYDNTPNGALKYIRTIFDIDKDKLYKICKKEHVDLERKFTSETDLYKFISLLSKNFFNEKEHMKKLEVLKEYFSNFFEGKSCVFDIGYSARPELFLSELCEKPIDTYFININHEEAIKHARLGNFRLNTFYDYKPTFTGLLREILFSKCAPSCIEYKIDNTVTPIFEEYHQTYQEKFLIGTIQNAALEFVNDMATIFGEYLNCLYYQNYYISLPYEMLLQSADAADRFVMDCITFEDDIRSSKKISVTEQWNKEVNWHNQHNLEELFTINQFNGYNGVDLSNRSKLIKTIYYVLIDRTHLKETAKKKLKKHNITYNISKESYGLLRKMKNGCYKLTMRKK